MGEQDRGAESQGAVPKIFSVEMRRFNPATYRKENLLLTCTPEAFGLTIVTFPDGAALFFALASMQDPKPEETGILAKWIEFSTQKDAWMYVQSQCVLWATELWPKAKTFQFIITDCGIDSQSPRHINPNGTVPSLEEVQRREQVQALVKDQGKALSMEFVRKCWLSGAANNN